MTSPRAIARREPRLLQRLAILTALFIPLLLGSMNQPANAAFTYVSNPRGSFVPLQCYQGCLSSVTVSNGTPIAIVCTDPFRYATRVQASGRYGTYVVSNQYVRGANYVPYC